MYPAMPDTDPFDPGRWETTDETVPRISTSKRKSGAKRPRRFLKGPIPWPWLVKAMTIRGRALAVALLIWMEVGCAGSRTIYFSIARAVTEGIPESTGRRAIRALEAVGLIAVRRKPGRGLEVTIMEVAA
jgi:hypothetical protein